MLTEIQIIRYLTDRNISYNNYLTFTTSEAHAFLDHIRDHLATSFANFVEFCLFDRGDFHLYPEVNLVFNFSSWEDLYECYSEFMIGCLGYRA